MTTGVVWLGSGVMDATLLKGVSVELTSPASTFTWKVTGAGAAGLLCFFFFFPPEPVEPPLVPMVVLLVVVVDEVTPVVETVEVSAEALETEGANCWRNGSFGESSSRRIL